MEIDEEELERRRKLLPPMRIAGPDDPIYSSGLRMTSFSRLRRSPPKKKAPKDESGDP